MLNIIYDASILTNIFYKDSGRSGVFFAAFNMFNELQKRRDVKVFMYFSPEAYADGVILKEKFYKDVECLQDLSKHKVLCKMYRKLRQWYSCFYHRTFFRKFIALGLGILYRIFLWTIRAEPKKIKTCSAYLSPLSYPPRFIRGSSHIKSYIFMYDMIPFIFPQYYSNQKPQIRIVMENVTNEDYFFFDSLCAKDDASRLFPSVVKDNASVIPLAATENFRQIKDSGSFESIRKKYNLPGNKKYIFSLCTIEPRKNLVRAVSCFIMFIQKHNITDLVWVMGGGHWDSFVKELRKKGVKWDSKYIVQAGYIDDEDLPVLYSNAEWFVYTSQYEGFGLPPLEAMQCGCPVITSNNSSLPEVVGEAAITIDWDSDEQHVESYEKYYFDEILRKEMAKKGLERAKMFSWEKTVDGMVGVMMSASAC